VEGREAIAVIGSSVPRFLIVTIVQVAPVDSGGFRDPSPTGTPG